MAKAMTWVRIERPTRKEDWHGHIRHTLRQDWVDGIEHPDNGHNDWERLEATFKQGDRVVVHEGLGDYSLGIFLRLLPRGMAALRLDGYITPEGTRHEPYNLAVNLDYVEKDLVAKVVEFADGYAPIRAALIENEFSEEDG